CWIIWKKNSVVSTGFDGRHPVRAEMGPPRLAVASGRVICQALFHHGVFTKEGAKPWQPESGSA
ncbi:hypothetical protein, partial [Paracoccus sp. UBA5162]|uniref:hypothetical protein n=1 Tax=Paracoccus sp. UBA5162 TaxID=1947054 RepID=UPI0025E333C8